MIKSFKIVNNIGESISLDIRKPEDTGFLVSSVAGLTYPKADISGNEIAMFDGTTVTNRRIGARNIVMGIIFYDSNNDKNTIEELRHKCYRYFPIKEEITFYVTNDSGTYRIKGYIEANETNIFTKAEAAQISIICPDPYFIKTDSDRTTYVSSIIPNFCFPVSFEFSGDSTPDGFTRYSASYVIVPKKSGMQTITLEGTATYGNFVITKVIGTRINNGSGKGTTLTIKGAATPDIPGYVDESEFIWNFEKYNGSASTIVFTPSKTEQYFEAKGYYFDASDPSSYHIEVPAIPSTITSNGAGKGQTLEIL